MCDVCGPSTTTHKTPPSSRLDSAHGCGLLWQRLRAGFCRGAERPAGVELGELERGLLTSTGVSAASDVDDVRVAAEAARVAYTHGRREKGVN